MKVSKPHVLPVLDNGKLVGVITRENVLEALRPIYGERMNIVETQRELETA
jgi:CBS domain-containing protein